MHNIIITGCNGYIGFKFVNALLRKNCNIYGMDLDVSHNKGLENKDDFKYFRADITNAETFSGQLKEADVLIHCAALVHKRSPDLSRENYFRINCEGTKNMLDFLDRDRLKQIIFLSTVSVYGDVLNGIEPDENTQASPEDFYGESKLAAEDAIREFSDKHKIPYTIFRLTPVYGELFLLNINKRIYLPGKTAFYKIGSGDQRLSLASVNNVVDVVVGSINNGNYFNRTFIVKDIGDYSINEIISTFKDIFSQHSKPVVRVPLRFPEAAFKLLGFVMPERARYYGYQLRKIAGDAVYSGAKLHSMVQPKWNLKNTLKKC